MATIIYHYYLQTRYYFINSNNYTYEKITTATKYDAEHYTLSFELFRGSKNDLG